MAWTNKDKTEATLQRSRILTSDSDRVLVGSSESKILIYQAYLENWGYKSKTDESGSYTNKTKISA